MVVVKLLQKGTENKMFGHPAGDKFALVSSICQLLNDEELRDHSEWYHFPSFRRHERNTENHVLQSLADC